MKKLVLAALLASFTFGASAAEKINFGVSATYPPFESIGANNEIVGFDIDLAKALCKQMQAECTFTNHAFDSLIPSLKFRKYDAVISGMDITPERSKQVSFTTPYYENSAVVIAKKDTLAILLPYAFKRSLSSYSNEVVLVFKSTSLAYTITLMEVMGYSQLLYGRTYDVMVFGAAGIIYLVVNGLLTLMMRLIERKALAFERRN